MVTRTILILMAGMLSCPVLSEQKETFEAFRREVGDAQNKIDYSKQLLRHDQLHLYIPEEEGIEEEKKAANDKETSQSGDSSSAVGSGLKDDQRSAKEDKGSTQVESSAPESEPIPSETDSAKRKKEAESTKEKGGSISRKGIERANVYIAPSLRLRSSVSNEAAVSQPESKSVIFGIRIGTEIDVELVGGASNVQNGWMKFRVTRTVVGDKRHLPLNTLLFAHPTAVQGSPRLFTSSTMRGITPDGLEFSLNASIRANDRQSGLLAYVVNDGKTLYRAADEGKTALAQNLLSLAPGGVMADAGKAAASQVVTEQQSESRVRYGSGVYVVQANPQPAVIEIEETF